MQTFFLPYWAKEMMRIISLWIYMAKIILGSASSGSIKWISAAALVKISILIKDLLGNYAVYLNCPNSSSRLFKPTQHSFMAAAIN